MKNFCLPERMEFYPQFCRHKEYKQYRLLPPAGFIYMDIICYSVGRFLDVIKEFSSSFRSLSSNLEFSEFVSMF